jgi:hypothetical protein
MSAVEGKHLPVGFRSAVVFELSASGRPKATGATAYEGLRWEGPKAFSISVPKPRQESHYGGDRVLANDSLPPTEGASATLNVSDHRMEIDALVSGTKVITVGEAKEVGWGTSEQGYEPQVGLLLYQQSLDLTTGARRYHAYVIPRAICNAESPSLSDKPEDKVYSVTPQVVKQRLWGITLVKATDGYTSAQYFEYETTFPPNVVSFLGDAANLIFSFPAAYQCANVAKAIVTVDGVVAPAGDITITTDKVTFGAGKAPAAAAEVVVFYEADI